MKWFLCFFQPIKVDDRFTGLSSKGINGSFFFYPTQKEIQVFFSVDYGQTLPDMPRLLQVDGWTLRLIGELNDEKN